MSEPNSAVQEPSQSSESLQGSPASDARKLHRSSGFRPHRCQTPFTASQPDWVLMSSHAPLMHTSASSQSALVWHADRPVGGSAREGQPPSTASVNIDPIQVNAGTPMRSILARPLSRHFQFAGPLASILLKQAAPLQQEPRNSPLTGRYAEGAAVA